MVLLLFRIEEVSFLFFPDSHSCLHNVLLSSILNHLVQKDFLCPAETGGLWRKKALTKPSAATFRSVMWLLSAHMVQMVPHNSFENTEILAAIISPRVFPGQIPTTASLHDKLLWKTALNTLWPKTGMGVKLAWGLNDLAEALLHISGRAQNKSCSSRHRLLSTFPATSGGGHRKWHNNIHLTSPALPKTSSYTLWPETCHNHSALLDLSLPLKDKHLTVGASAWRQEPAVLCG